MYEAALLHNQTSFFFLKQEKCTYIVITDDLHTQLGLYIGLALTAAFAFFLCT